MTLPQRIAVNILESIGTHLWGFKPNMMRHFVLEYGALKSVMWFVKHMPKYEKILKKWGPVRTHLVATVLSTLHGCEYCTYGHAYALQLQYFKHNNKLFPLDESELINLHTLPEVEVFNRISAALTEAGLESEMELLNRIGPLREQSPAAQQNQNDEYLLHLMSMFSVLNTCGIKRQVVPDEAHDPINKDKPIRERYAAARAETVC